MVIIVAVGVDAVGQTTTDLQLDSATSLTTLDSATGFSESNPLVAVPSAIRPAGPLNQSAQQSNGPTVQFGNNGDDLSPLDLNLRWGDDQIPTDIANNRGVFIVSTDRTKVLRIYGSLRMRANWDDREVDSP